MNKLKNPFWWLKLAIMRYLRSAWLYVYNFTLNIGLIILGVLLKDLPVQVNYMMVGFGSLIISWVIIEQLLFLNTAYRGMLDSKLEDVTIIDELVKERSLKYFYGIGKSL